MLLTENGSIYINDETDMNLPRCKLTNNARISKITTRSRIVRDTLKIKIKTKNNKNMQYTLQMIHLRPLHRGLYIRFNSTFKKLLLLLRNRFELFLRIFFFVFCSVPCCLCLCFVSFLLLVFLLSLFVVQCRLARGEFL